LNVANAVWRRRGYRFEGAYPDTLARHHGAELQTLDFRQTEAATGEIDGWVAGETGGRSEDLLPPDAIEPDTRMVLTNAVYFKGSWWCKFEKAQTGDGPFTLHNGDEVTVPMMRQNWKFSYAEGADYQAVQLPYDGDAADMLVILPDEGRFGWVEKRLGANLLDELSASLSDRSVKPTMPRFDFEEDLELIDLMKGLGLRLPFDPYGADFSGITKKSDSTSTKRYTRPQSPSTRGARRRPRPLRSWTYPSPAEESLLR
jgi:serpin B